MRHFRRRNPNSFWLLVGIVVAAICIAIVIGLTLPLEAS